MRFSSPRISSIAALGLLALMLVLAWGAERRESVTTDEVAHLGAGLSYLQKLDLRLNEEHPPLSKVLAALPLFATGARADYAGSVWTHSSSFFAGLAGEWIFGSEVLLRWNDPRRTLTLARIPMMLLTLALGWCVFCFARLLGGDLAGVLCLSVYVSTPLFLAVGPLVLTDVALALFALLAIWTFASLWRDPTRRNVVLFSAAMAAAILSKFSAGLLFFALAAFIAISLRWPLSAQPPSQLEIRKWRSDRVRATFRGILLSALWVYLFLLYFSWNQPMDVPGLAGTGVVGAWVGRMLMPVWVFVRGMVLFVVMAGRSSYILGHDYWHGVWFYFPVMFVLKSAPGFLGLLALLAIVATRTAVVKCTDAYSDHRRIVWVTCVVFGGLCIASHFNTDFRHLSLPVTLLILMFSALPRAIAGLTRVGARRASTITAVVLVFSCLFTAVSVYPFYIPYINAFGMGRPAWKLVNGGNVDWNQSLYEINTFARMRGLTEILVSPYGMSEVGEWVQRGKLWDCQDAAPRDAGQWVVISANNLVSGRTCAWLSQYPQEMLAGGSLFAIRLPADIPAPGYSGRPTVRAAPLRNFGMEQDVESTYIFLVDHPATFPAYVAPFETAMTARAKRMTMRLMKILKVS